MHPKHQEELEDLIFRIALRPGRFELLFAEYDDIEMRSQVIKQVQANQNLSVEVSALDSHEPEDSMLPSPRSSFLFNREVLIVTGLDNLDYLDQVLDGTDKELLRFEKYFKKVCVVFWMTHDTYEKIKCQAPAMYDLATFYDFRINELGS